MPQRQYKPALCPRKFIFYIFNSYRDMCMYHVIAARRSKIMQCGWKKTFSIIPLLFAMWSKRLYHIVDVPTLSSASPLGTVSMQGWWLILFVHLWCVLLNSFASRLECHYTRATHSGPYNIIYFIYFDAAQRVWIEPYGLVCRRAK